MSNPEPYGVPAAQEPLTAAAQPPRQGRPPTPPTPPAPKKKFGGWGFLLTVVIIVVAVAWGLYDARDTDSGAPLGGGLFGTQGAERLVTRLDAAAKTQQVCYGWEIDSDRPSISPYPRLRTTPSPVPVPSATSTEGVPPLPTLPPQPRRPGVDVGSNLGVDMDPRQDPRQCPKWVVFTADYNYSYADEEWTSVTRGVQTNLPITLSAGDLDAAGITGQDLLGDQADARLADTIGSLPMIVAEKGGGPAVPEAQGKTPPSGDKASSPGLTRYIWTAVAALLILGGLVWIITAAVRSRRGVGSPAGGRENREST